MTELVRHCPNCRTLRNADEFVCMGTASGGICGWDLTYETLIARDCVEHSRDDTASDIGLLPGCDSIMSDNLAKAEVATAAAALCSNVGGSLCQNGHTIDEGDLMCLICGGALQTDTPTTRETRTEARTKLDSAMPGTASDITSEIINGHGETDSPGKPANNEESPSSNATASAIEPRASIGNPGAVSIANIDDWALVEELRGTVHGIVRWRVSNPNYQTDNLVMEIHEHNEFYDPATLQLIEHMSNRGFARLVSRGISNGMRYEVWDEQADVGLQAFLTREATQRLDLRELVHSLGQLIADLAAQGIRHRDVQPANIKVHGENPFTPVLCGFHFAVASDFDLELIPLPQTSRYSAPEAHLGAVSPCSDWWSLGIILLEFVTAGQCFSGIDDKVFLLNAVTEGVALPNDIDDDTYALLSGLLERASQKRWQWSHIQQWLNGQHGVCDRAANESPAPPEVGPSISLNSKFYRSCSEYALRAASPVLWNEAMDQFRRGELATWIERLLPTAGTAGFLRELRLDQAISEPIKLALALLSMNIHMPLSIAGDIVTPAWLLENIESAIELLSQAVVMRLKQLNREQWLQDLATRAALIKQKIEIHSISVNEERLKASMLCTSRRNLENQWRWLRASFPDSEHRGILGLLEKRNHTEEDLIILISAQQEEFVSAAEILEQTRRLAITVPEISLDGSDSAAFLAMSRRELLDEIDNRLSGFACSGISVIDEWADVYRMERRISLPRALVLLSVPKSRWQPLPKQEYVGKIIDFLEKKVSVSIQRGPLVRLIATRTATTIDLLDLNGPRRTALHLLDALISRSGQSMDIDPAVLDEVPDLENRIRRLTERTTTFRRETGRHSLYLGFPLVSCGVRRSSDQRISARIAPLILWPIKVEASVGNRGRIALAFDRDHDEVRLNPALDTALNWAPGEFDKWRDAFNDLLGCSSLNSQSVMDSFALLGEVQSKELTKLPDKDFAPVPNKKVITASGALFHCDFAGKAIADDLRNIANRHLTGTALEIALRLREEKSGEVFSDAALYHVIDTDPSQERAIVLSRHSPGLHVEGPPGTGKSQTIVNIVADTIARGETALIVCQKQAALSVVEKRLRAEGLGDRLFLVTDVTRDRQPVIRALRDQIAEPAAKRIADFSIVSKDRDSIVARLLNCERELNSWHNSLYTVNDAVGLSYRQILCDLLLLQQKQMPSLPSLRRALRKCSNREVLETMEEAGSVARLWLSSSYEQSPLAALGDFLPHASDIELLNERLDALLTADEKRVSVCAKYPDAPDVDDTREYEEWLKENEKQLRYIPQELSANLAKWFALFSITSNEQLAQGSRLLSELKTLRMQLDNIAPDSFLLTLKQPLSTIDDAQLQRMIQTVSTALRNIGFFSFIDFPKKIKQKASDEYLQQLGATERGADRHPMLLRDCELENSIRPMRESLKSIGKILQTKPGTAMVTVQDLKVELARWLSLLEPVADAARRISACPARQIAETSVGKGNPDGMANLFDKIDGVFQRHSARTDSKQKLSQLSEWLGEEWLKKYESSIDAGANLTEELRLIRLATAQTLSYQQFRNRAKSLRPLTLTCLSYFRSLEAELKLTEAEALASTIRDVIQAESCLGWKEMMEVSNPLLCIDKTEVNARVATLSDCSTKLVHINRRLLSQPEPTAVIAPEREWESLTRLTGQRARRLREVVESGLELGLMKLRPIWLMNPEVVSRLMPLKPNLFDIVIFDEASQLPVEYSLPALYRAKRFVVSGDDKQMPPSYFFAAKLDSDEEELVESSEDDQSEEMKERLEENWNRRDIKDCPNILNLAAAVLPGSRLQVHYRSEYEQLIQYSNEAFYSGKLSVPAKHTDAQVALAKPIELLFANGLYDKQTNPTEARQVIELIKEIWFSSGEARKPTMGVATFNLKQADLITDLLQEEAERDDRFKSILQTEYEREENGEDMSFFVKNLENVQGDERDFIIFSTTFGRNRDGKFIRNFGKLGQVGGERRLNVAVTRARQKVVIVTSMPIAEISDFLNTRRTPTSPRDYLQAYLEYANRLSKGDNAGANLLLRQLSPLRSQSANSNYAGTGEPDEFVASVARYIEKSGFKATVRQGSKDAFGVDIAIEHPETGLYCFGIECDSPVHELLVRPSHREIWRRKMLSASLGTVYRISIRDWYHNLEREQNNLSMALRSATRVEETATL